MCDKYAMFLFTRVQNHEKISHENIVNLLTSPE